METVKSCQNCVMGKIHYSNNTCEVCTSTELSMWQPSEQTKKEYMIKLAEDGANGTTEYDVVSKPKHYMLFEKHEIAQRSADDKGIEVRDVIERLCSKFDYQGYPDDSPLFIADYVQLMQYLMRFMDKNGKEDLQKGRFYLDKMIEAY